MGQDSSFTEEDRALWHRRRSMGLEGHSAVSAEELDEMEASEAEEELEDEADLEGSDALGDTCILCGAPLSYGLPPDAEGGLCDACD